MSDPPKQHRRRLSIPAPLLNEAVAALVEVLRDQIEFDRPVLLSEFHLSFGRTAGEAVLAEVDRDPPPTVRIGGRRFVLPEARKAWLASRAHSSAEPAT